MFPINNYATQYSCKKVGPKPPTGPGSNDTSYLILVDQTELDHPLNTTDCTKEIIKILQNNIKHLEENISHQTEFELPPQGPSYGYSSFDMSQDFHRAQIRLFQGQLPKKDRTKLQSRW